MTNNKTRKNTYSKQDYNSNDGMLTTVWGPGLWHYLHTMSFNYPNNPTCDDKNNYRHFILNLKNTLPCGKCRKNLHKNFKELPLTMKDMQSRETFSRYVYKLHELINTMLNKRSGLSYNDVRERYEHFRARCSIPHDKINSNKTEKKKEDGCTEPLYGSKSKCILKIVPNDVECDTFEIDKKCVKTKK